MKTIFELENLATNESGEVTGKMQIIGVNPRCSPYVVILTSGAAWLYIKDKDLELFAVNVLKALKSKKLKP